MPLIHRAFLPLLVCIALVTLEGICVSKAPGGVFLVPAQLCPSCGYVLDAAREVVLPGEGSQGPPRPGDESVCWYCGEVLVTDAHGRLRLQAPREVSAAALEAQAWKRGE